VKEVFLVLKELVGRGGGNKQFRSSTGRGEDVRGGNVGFGYAWYDLSSLFLYYDLFRAYLLLKGDELGKIIVWGDVFLLCLSGFSLSS